MDRTMNLFLSGVGGQGLLQSKVSGLVSEVSRLEQFQRFPATVEYVCSGLESFYGIHDQV